jgi:GAF domain-containing protein
LAATDRGLTGQAWALPSAKAIVDEEYEPHDKQDQRDPEEPLDHESQPEHRDNTEYRAGRTVWSADVETDPKVTARERRAYQVDKTRSYVGVPIIKQSRLVAVL